MKFDRLDIRSMNAVLDERLRGMLRSSSRIEVKISSDGFTGQLTLAHDLGAVPDGMIVNIADPGAIDLGAPAARTEMLITSNEAERTTWTATNATVRVTCSASLSGLSIAYVWFFRRT